MGSGDEPVDDDLTCARDPLSEDVDKVALAIMDRWELHADNPLAGVIITPSSGVVTVYRVPGDAAFDADALSHRSDRVSVILFDVPRNLAGNQEIVHAILA
jgi:hypothetical protein